MADLKLAILISAVDKASAVLAGVHKGVQAVGDAGAKVQAAGKAMATAGAGITMFGVAGAMALGNIVAPAMALEQSMLQLGTTARAALGGDVTQAMGQARDAALSWSQSHVGSAQEYVAATQRMLVVTGSAGDSVAAAAVAMKLAGAANIDAASASELLARTYDQLGDKSGDVTTEMTRLSDILVTTQAAFGLQNIAALPEALSKAIPAAEMTGVSLEQLAAAMGTLEAAGLKGEGAGASLGAALQQMEAASRSLDFQLVRTSDGGLDFAATLANLEGKVGNVSDMSPAMAAKLAEAFGPGNEAIIKLIGQSGNLSATLETLQGSAGATEEAFRGFDSSGAGAMKKLQQNADALKIELSAALLPALLELAPPVIDLVKEIAAFAKKNPEIAAMAAKFAVLAVAAALVIGPVLTVGGGLVTLVGTLMTAVPAVLGFAGTLLATAVPALLSAAAGAWAFALALLANPITWIAIAIVVAAALIYVYWDEIAAYFTGIWAEIEAAFNTSFIGGVMKVVENLDPFKHLVNAVNFLVEEWFGVDLIGKASAWLQQLTFDSFVDSALAVLVNLTPLPAIQAGWNAAKGWLSGFSLSEIVTGIVSGGRAALALMNPVDLVMNGFNAVVAWLSGFELGSTGSRIAGSLMNGIVADLASLGAAVMAPVDGIVALLEGFSLADAGANIVNTLVAGIKSVASAPGAAMADIVAAVRAYLPFSPAKVGPLRDLNKIRLVETIAETIVPGPIVGAMDATMTQAMAPLATGSDWMPNVVGESGGVAPSRGAGGGGGAGAGDGRPLEVTFNLVGAGASAIAELEAWIANPTNAKKMAAAIDRVKQREAATAY